MFAETINRALFWRLSVAEPGHYMNTNVLPRRYVMMHQPVEPHHDSNERIARDEIIQKDEIISLRIDLETLSPVEIHHKHFRFEPQT